MYRRLFCLGDVPEIRGAGAFLQLGDFLFLGRQVKDAPGCVLVWLLRSLDGYIVLPYVLLGLVDWIVLRASPMSSVRVGSVRDAYMHKPPSKRGLGCASQVNGSDFLLLHADVSLPICFSSSCR
jgi:hypothetical protein